MTKYIAFKGLRAGVGTSTICANLASAWQKLGQQVVVIDLCPNNDLKWHLGVKNTYQQGWLASMINAKSFDLECLSNTLESQKIQFRSPSGLIFFPFGKVLSDQIFLRQALYAPEGFLQQFIGKLVLSDDVIIIFHLGDLSCLFESWLPEDTIKLLVANATMNSYQRLCGCSLDTFKQARHLIINDFDPDLLLQQDLKLLLREHWYEHVGEKCTQILKDEFISQALAHNTNVIDAFVDSYSAKSFHLLAIELLMDLQVRHDKATA
ncbi:cellulose synthase operon protein YhjQ/BcsQ [Paraferrimonas sp. SM1919]|uniref:cellulose synthase operon protein YhjQ/BcsQ n=1 Tax=Paraferrimonas sp. SM1919 TaxID=2662263 RepID=UPI0013D41CA3|nr:cellulose synthase operon protein YhjQ/BcsQ [Paraferrimonas sp. SM1919]